MIGLLEANAIAMEDGPPGVVKVQAALDAPILLKILRAPGAFAGMLTNLLPTRGGSEA